jgi:hypothetical protein
VTDAETRRHGDAENEMKIALVLGLALAGIVGSAAGFPVLAGEVQPRTVTVTGEAEVKVVPDEVVLTLGVETVNKELLAAKSENDRRVKAIIKAASDAGVAAKDVQTDFIQIEPRYRDGYEQKDFIGYFVQKTVVVTLRDVSKFESLLTAVLQAGANYVHGIDFRTSALRKHRDEARALAIKAAKEKAAALAGDLGKRIGNPRSIQEGSMGSWSSYGGWWGRGYGQAMTQNVIQSVQGGTSGSEAFAPGTISVKASIGVTFELE